jgi:hypothetical protein
MFKKYFSFFLIITASQLFGMYQKVDWDKFFSGRPIICCRKINNNNVYQIVNNGLSIELVRSPQGYRAQIKFVYGSGGIQTFIFQNETQENLE